MHAHISLIDGNIDNNQTNNHNNNSEKQSNQNGKESNKKDSHNNKDESKKYKNNKKDKTNNNNNGNNEKKEEDLSLKKTSLESSVKIIKSLLPFFWPHKQPLLRLRVVACLLLIVMERYMFYHLPSTTWQKCTERTIVRRRGVGEEERRRGRNEEELDTR